MGDSKRFFYPTPLEELLSIKSTSINQEKELDFQQRRNNMERDALKEEKLRTEKERGQKFLEGDFDFKGEDEETAIPKVDIPDQVKFKTSNKPKKDSEQLYTLVEYAKLPDKLKELFKIKKAEKPPEDGSVEYLNFDKTTKPNLYKHSRKLKVRKVESDIVNLYDMDMKSLLTSTEISKRAELLAKLYMKYHYDEEKYTKHMEDQKFSNKKNEKGLGNAAIKADGSTDKNSLLSEIQKAANQNAPKTGSLPPDAKPILCENFPAPPQITLPPPPVMTSQTKPAVARPVINPASLKLPGSSGGAAKLDIANSLAAAFAKRQQG